MGSAAFSWSTSRRCAASTASPGSRRRCSPTTTGCWACSGQRASRRRAGAQDGEVSVELRTEASPAAVDAADRPRVALRGPFAAPAAVSRERRGGRRTPHRGRPGQRRARGDPRGGLRRPAVRRAPGGRLRGRPAGPPQPGRDRGHGRPRGGRGARRSGHVRHGRRCRGGSGRGDRRVVRLRRPSTDSVRPVQRELLRTARAHSVRMVGPDSQGVLSQGPELHLNATFARALPGPGGLAIASQSGGVGFTLLDLARDLGVGVHSFVSLGAKLDVSSNDLLAAWMDDDAGRCRRTPSGVVRQRAQVRPDRPPVRGAQAPAGRPRWPVDGLGDRRRRPVRPGGRDRVPQRHRGGRDRGAAVGAAAAGRLPGRRGHQRGRHGHAGGRPRRRRGALGAGAVGRGTGRRGRGGARRRQHPQPGRPRGRSVPRRPRGRRTGAALRTRARRGRGGPGPHQPGRPRRVVRRRLPGPGAVGATGPARRVQRSRARSPRRGDRLPNRGGSGGGAGAHDEVRRVAAGPGRGTARGTGRPGRIRPGVGRPASRRAGRGGRVAAGCGECRAARVVRHRTRRPPGPGRRRGRAGPRWRSASRSW